MARPNSCHFPLIDRYMGIRLDTDLASVAPGMTTVVESARRLHREENWSFIHALWWLWLADGRSVVSVPAGCGDLVSGVASRAASARSLLDPALAEQLICFVNEALVKAGLRKVNRVFSDMCFACDGPHLRLHSDGECTRLVDESLLPAEGLRLPKHCFPDGIAYGVLVGDRVVSVAYAHRTGVMEDLVADIGVETALDFRRRGYARTAVSRLVQHVAGVGGEARYACAPDNQASIATAHSVGFVHYSTSLILAAPAEDVVGA